MTDKTKGMKKILKPSYSSMKFETKWLLERGEIYVCDNLQDIVVHVVFKDVANNDIESHINILKSIVIDYINRQSRNRIMERIKREDQ